MITRRRLTVGQGCLVAFVVLATLIKFALNETFDNFKDETEHVSYSKAEAKSKGTLVQNLSWTPQEIVVDNQRLTIQEAWLEERHLHSHRFVWFPSVQKLGGTNLCVLVPVSPYAIKLAGAPNTGTSRHGGGESLYLFPIDREGNQPFVVNVVKILGGKDAPRATVTFRPQ